MQQALGVLLPNNDMLHAHRVVNCLTWNLSASVLEGLPLPCLVPLENALTVTRKAAKLRLATSGMRADSPSLAAPAAVQPGVDRLPEAHQRAQRPGRRDQPAASDAPGAACD